MPDIDASEAIAALGITRPVKFKFGPIGRVGWARILGMVNVYEPDTVQLDLEAIAENAEEWQPHRPLEVIIGHELVHVRQNEDFSEEEMVHLNTTHVYEENPLEREASAREAELAKLIKVSR